MGQQRSVDVSRDLPSPIVPPPLPPSGQDDRARSATSSMAIPLAKLFSYRKLRKSGHLRHQNKNTGSISYFSTSPVHSFIIRPILVLDYQQESTSIYNTWAEYFGLSRSSCGVPTENPLYTGRSTTAFPEYFDIPGRHEIASYNEAGELPRSPSVRMDNI